MCVYVARILMIGVQCAATVRENWLWGQLHVHEAKKKRTVINQPGVFFK
jgi:hypothetical protein